MHMHDPTSTRKHKDVDRSDLEHVFQSKDFGSWDDAINWLKREGDRDNELTPGEVRHMIDDFQTAKSQGMPFDLESAVRSHDH